MSHYESSYNELIEENGVIAEVGTINPVYNAMVENAIADLAKNYVEDYYVWETLYNRAARSAKNRIAFLRFNAWRHAMRTAGFEVR